MIRKSKQSIAPQGSGKNIPEWRVTSEYWVKIWDTGNKESAARYHCVPTYSSSSFSHAKASAGISSLIVAHTDGKSMEP